MTDKEYARHIVSVWDNRESWKSGHESVADVVKAIRAEVLKEAAERAVKYVDKNYNDMGEWDSLAFDDFRAAILGDTCANCAESVDGAPGVACCGQCRELG